MTYRSNSPRWPTPEQLHKEDDVFFWVFHYHNGNDPDGTQRKAFAAFGREPPIYVTECQITNRGKDLCLGYGAAFCSSKDNPNRRLGHEIAVTRAIRDYMERKEHPDKYTTVAPEVSNLPTPQPKGDEGYDANGSPV